MLVDTLKTVKLENEAQRVSYYYMHWTSPKYKFP